MLFRSTGRHYLTKIQCPYRREKNVPGESIIPITPGNGFQDDLLLQVHPTAKTANNAMKAATMQIISVSISFSEGMIA